LNTGAARHPGGLPEDKLRLGQRRTHPRLSLGGHFKHGLTLVLNTMYVQAEGAFNAAADADSSCA
jgi:hypothetical protein